MLKDLIRLGIGRVRYIFNASAATITEGLLYLRIGRDGMRRTKLLTFKRQVIKVVTLILWRLKVKRTGELYPKPMVTGSILV
jgi:hypothetical protein